MRGNHVRRRLKAGEPSIGTWLSLPSPEAAEYCSQLGFDWLTVDSEHNPIDIRTLAQMFAAMAASNTAPMVRIPWNSGENFKRVLDAGAWGVVVPMVRTREEAELAVASARYYPEGDRSVGGGRAAMSFGTTGEHYLRHANNEILVVLQIEHMTGVENADAILSVPGVDACFIGPNDLAGSLGFPGQMHHPDVQRTIDEIIVQARAAGKAVGVGGNSDAESVRRNILRGATYLTLSYAGFIGRASRALLARARES